jgi:hypothetical protein
MRKFRLMPTPTFRAVILLLSALALVAVLANAQDDESPSLGDVARQARLKKQKEAQADAKDQTQAQSQPGNAANAGKVAVGKTASDKDASGNDTLLVKGSKKVITNEELPEHVGPTSTLPQHPRNTNLPDQPAQDYADGKVPAQYWKAQIRALKEGISNLESQIQDVTDSIRYASGSCVSNCAQLNEQQQQKEQEVKMMTSQLAQQQQSLETMQETARKQGYGSSVYDP